MAETSILQEEAEHFGKLAGDWWDPKGASAMLHKLNPVRLGYVRDWIDQHWSLDEHSRRPLEGKTALDVGCGAGLLAEPLARLGAKVTALDPAAELIGAAREHAAGQGLEVDYRLSAIEDVSGTFNLITSMEVIEHTADPQQFLDDLAKRLAPDGLLILSTPNATAWSKLITITLAEGFGAIPKGTHDFDKFIAPERMKQLMANSGLKCLDVEGIAFSPTRGLHLSEDLRLNYLVAATHS
ncbi:MAG TPA: bifunctional 2-polyprenyl-6-hydroxyphenol methylase/3-demethylubiquinol 3-O-methyltransferase UbiG [Sphingomicrobium sp.]|jgi:2-polyprenyl-6-hydroxyphenyl methylase/3-demethylubiquinone-9 3-methyltransferase